MIRAVASAALLLGFLTLMASTGTGCEGDRAPTDESKQAAMLGCSQNEQCEDGNPCTQNLCLTGLCAPPLPVVGCCLDGQCSEGGAGGEGGTGTPHEPAGGSAGTSQGGSAGTSQGGTTGQGGSLGDGAAPSSSGGIDAGAGGTTASGDGATSSQAGDPATVAIASGGAHGSDEIDDTKWMMAGGSCTVSHSGASSSASLLAFAVGVAFAWRRRRRRLAALAMAGPLVISTQASAAGFAQDAYTAPVAPEDLMWTERAGSDSGHVRPFARLTLGFTDDPLVLVDANDSRRQIRVVDDQFGMYAAVGLGLFHRGHVALSMPFYLQSSAITNAKDVKGARPGDVGIDARFAILPRRAPLELALAGTLRVPSGNQSAYASDGAAGVWLRALLSKQLGDAGTLVNLSVGPVLRRAHEEGGATLGSQLRFTAGALFALSRALGVTAELAGSTPAADPFLDSSTPVEGALGGRITLAQVVLGSSLGTGLTSGVGAPDFRWLATVSFPAGCPEAHDDTSPSVQAPVADADGDGVRLPADRCPDEAEDRDGFEDEDGCPESDNDKDGVPDAKDRCPADAEDRDGFEDEDGCPESDNDKDGILEPKDQCPDKAEDLDHWQDEDGCPESDNDQDGLADAQDKCPNEPESKNGKDDEDGCPDLVRVEEGQIRTLEPVYFDYNKASIQARSETMLGEMAALIKSRPDLGTIAIEGHTDAKGSATYNLKLSRDRAAAVRAYLVRAGVAEERVTSDGFGSTKPIDDNKTELGRAKNRRVEFRFSL
jgi:large repetitive protein